MSKQFKDFRLPNLESNKILILDDDKKITTADITINELDKYFITKELINTYNKESNPEGIAYLQEILDKYKNDNIIINNIYIWNNELNCYTSTIIKLTEENNYRILSSLADFSSEFISSLDLCSLVNNQTYYGIELTIVDNIIEQVSTNLYGYGIEKSNTVLPVLVKDSNLDGEDVTYLPTTDSQPANKKYVDQEINKVETIIGNIQELLTDINGEVLEKELADNEDIGNN